MAKVDLPADSAPKISVTRPRGIPPVPSAMSIAKDPVEMDSVTRLLLISPKRMTAPLPWSFSMLLRAMSSAAFLSVPILSFFITRHIPPDWMRQG